MDKVHLPLVESELPSEALPADGRRHAIIPADVKGRFHAARNIAFYALIALWAGLPWVNIGGHPAVFADIDSRELYLFGSVFNAQDTWLLFFLMTGIGFGLVYVTALAGRVWCGWACPQTVFLEGVYRRIERAVEGSREKRLRRNAAPWTAGTVLRKIATHTLYVAVSFLIAHIFLSYFTSLPKAFEIVRHDPGLHPEAFAWAMATTAVLYLNFGWFREQLCVVLCPYGRLQSALLDEHSLVVGYDVKRGEPRGKRGTPGAGDCVDDRRCVVVCPTGIDIRNGLQMECVACTACIDACDDIMDRLQRPRGLVRYDSPDGLAGRPRRIVRLRVVLYTALLVVGAVVAILATRRRTDFEVTLLRLSGAPYTVDAGQVRDALQVHIVNKRASADTFHIEVEPVDGMTAVIPMATVSVGALSDVRVPVFLSLPRERFRGDFALRVHVARSGGEAHGALVSATFLGPSS